MRLYQKLFQEMLANHEELFTRFKDIHDKFAADQENHRIEFNHIGQEVLEVIRRYEKKLCGSTERSTYSKYSANLSEKLWQPVRMLFPKIDYIGIK